MQHSKIIKLVLALAMIVGCFETQAQTLQLHVNSHPSPYLSDWQQHKETAAMTIVNTGGSAIRFKVNTQLYDGSGTMIAETDLAKMPVEQLNPGATFQHFFEDIYPEAAVKYHGNYDVNGITRSGKLKDDNYRLCVQLKDPVTGADVTAPQCRMFTIVAYQQPTLILSGVLTEDYLQALDWTPVRPRDPDTNYSTKANWTPVRPRDPDTNLAAGNWTPVRPRDPDTNAQANFNWTPVRPRDPDTNRVAMADWTPVLPGCPRCYVATAPDLHKQYFRWTPVMPRPCCGAGVAYRLVVMEILPGQEPGQAFRANQPIVDKELKNMTVTNWPQDFQQPEEGKSYVWSVQSLDDQGRPMGENNGWAEYAVFSICDANAPKFKWTPVQPSTRVTLKSPANGSSLDDAPTFKWTPVQPSGRKAVTYRLQIYEVGNGQTPGQAYRTNKPIFEKDYKNKKKASLPDTTGLETGKTYVWGVRVMTDNGKGIGDNEGRSGDIAVGKGIGDNEGRSGDIAVGKGIGDNEGRWEDIAVGKGIGDNEGRSEYATFRLNKPMSGKHGQSRSQTTLIMGDQNTIDGNQQNPNHFEAMGYNPGYAMAYYYYTLTRSGDFTSNTLVFSIDGIAWGTGQPNQMLIDNNTHEYRLSGNIPYGTECGATETIALKLYAATGQLVQITTFTIRNPYTPTPVPNFKIFGSDAAAPTIINICGSGSTNVLMNNLQLIYTGTGTVTRYHLSIHEANSSGAEIPGGYSYNPDYYTPANWVNGSVPATILLNSSLPGPTGSPVPNNYTYYLVTLRAEAGPCAQVTGIHTALIHLSPLMCEGVPGNSSQIGMEQE